MIGIDWIAELPVPITATRLPVKSTPSFGQRPVWYFSPVKVSAPSNSGMLADERQPVANTTYLLVTASPESVTTVHVLVASPNLALTTDVSNVMSLRRS